MRLPPIPEKSGDGPDPIASLLAMGSAQTPGFKNQAQTETKKKLKTNPAPTNHTSERRIAQSAR